MKILHVNDLHLNTKDFDWLLKESPKYDLICLSGDFLDMFSYQKTELQQIRKVYSYFLEIRKFTKLAIGTGNHDGCKVIAIPKYDDLEDPLTKEICSLEDWTDILTGLNGIIAPGTSEIVEDVVVTPTKWVPWGEGNEINSELIPTMIEGRELSLKHNKKWIVLIHEPPDNTTIAHDGSSMNNGAAYTNYVIDEFQPGIVHSGHIHQAPFVEGGSWVTTIGNTVCINPGSSPKTDYPSHCIYELEKGLLWFSEDEKPYKV